MSDKFTAPKVEKRVTAVNEQIAQEAEMDNSMKVLTQKGPTDVVDIYKEGIDNFRNFLAGNLFQADPPLFIENHLSAALIDKITSNLDDEIVDGASDTFREELSTSTVVDVFSDGISDVAVLLTANHDLYHLRFKSEPNDLPIIKNGNSDVKTDDSKELPVGEGGNVNTGEQSELPNSSTEGELVTDDDLELEIE
jgi:hypothetical protein